MENLFEVEEEPVEPALGEVGLRMNAQAQGKVTTRSPACDPVPVVLVWLPDVRDLVPMREVP